MTILARGLSRRPTAVGTYIRFGAGGVFRRFWNSLLRMSRVQVWRRGKAFGAFLGNSLESDFNWAGIRGPGSGVSEGRNAEERKSPGGGIRLGIRNRAEAKRRRYGRMVAASGRSEGHGGRRETKRCGRGDSRVQEETAPGAFPEQIRP